MDPGPPGPAGGPHRQRRLQPLAQLGQLGRREPLERHVGQRGQIAGQPLREADRAVPVLGRLHRRRQRGPGQPAAGLLGCGLVRHRYVGVACGRCVAGVPAAVRVQPDRAVEDRGEHGVERGQVRLPANERGARGPVEAAAVLRRRGAERAGEVLREADLHAAVPQPGRQRGRERGPVDAGQQRRGRGHGRVDSAYPRSSSAVVIASRSSGVLAIVPSVRRTSSRTSSPAPSSGQRRQPSRSSRPSPAPCPAPAPAPGRRTGWPRRSAARSRQGTDRRRISAARAGPGKSIQW